MEHVNDLCFRDIYKGGLWDDDLLVKTIYMISVPYRVYRVSTRGGSLLKRGVVRP